MCVQVALSSILCESYAFYCVRVHVSVMKLWVHHLHTPHFQRDRQRCGSYYSVVNPGWNQSHTLFSHPSSIFQFFSLFCFDNKSDILAKRLLLINILNILHITQREDVIHIKDTLLMITLPYAIQETHIVIHNIAKEVICDTS